jgi:hypothetical protein
VNTKAYFQSLTAEFEAVKNRVSDLIGPVHRPSEGGWRESVLRSVLRRHLPSKFHVGSGFVISTDGSSTQIDVLILDDKGPVLFRDGDFVIVTPDVVAGVIEVKTGVTHATLRDALRKLDKIGQTLRSQPRHPPPFFGLFAFEPTRIRPSTLLEVLKATNGGFGNYEVNCITLGARRFIRFWQFPPHGPKRRYSKWHAYDLNELGYGYFVHNVLESIFPEVLPKNQNLWYPVDGKESRKVAEIAKYGEEES